ncbi:MAG TPA: CPBP family intramembrane glutamic endopeptidase [Fusobacterium sp.]|uniref:CPBP family intramembrane glutamic endopeptidase n=1 Tax=Fusobacterium sp. TaxID=68766 RepID=UPI002F411545
MEDFVSYRKIGISKSILLCLGVLFLYDFINSFVWGYAEAAMSEETFEQTSYYFFDSIICAILCFLFFFLYMGFRWNFKQSKTKSYHSFWILLQSIIITLGVSGLTNLWLDFSYSKLSHIPFVANSIKSYDATWEGIEKEPYFYVLLSVVILGPLVEEFMFRGIIFRLLEEQNVYLALILSSLFFGLWHMEFIQSVYTVFLGFATVIVYFRTQSLIYPMFIHILYNFLSTLPSSWDNDMLYSWIDKIELFMILPCFLLLFFMIKSNKKRVFLR